jgi:hypothetical protein
MPDLLLPVTFRSEILQPLLANLIAHRSCSLVGVGSSGKSNVARHIQRADVREYYLGDDARNVLILYVNCAKLPEYTGYALYCSILEAVEDAVKEARPEATALNSVFMELWETAVHSGATDLARRNVNRALEIIFEQLDIRQCFTIFDDFDKVFAQVPAAALNSFRALRDDYKTQIKYVTVTRRELGFLRDPGEIEDFFELVAPNTIAIGPYSKTDALFMIERLAARESPPRRFSDEELEILMKASGHHAGLLMSIYSAIRDKEAHVTTDLPDKLAGHPAVVAECQRIWDSLEKDEREKLECVMREDQLAREQVRALLRKGIIRPGANDTFSVFSPMLDAFVIDQLQQRLPLQLLPARQVVIHNRVVTGLSDVEYQLLVCLVHQYPKPVALAQLIDVMLSDEAGNPAGGPPPRRLESYLGELKRKIRFDNWEYIFKLPGDRYVLREPSSS